MSDDMTNSYTFLKYLNTHKLARNWFLYIWLATWQNLISNLICQSSNKCPWNFEYCPPFHWQWSTIWKIGNKWSWSECQSYRYQAGWHSYQYFRFWIKLEGKWNEMYRFLFQGVLNWMKKLRFWTPLNSSAESADGLQMSLVVSETWSFVFSLIPFWMRIHTSYFISL
jgi:hypothetical protein